MIETIIIRLEIHVHPVVCDETDVNKIAVMIRFSVDSYPYSYHRLLYVSGYITLITDLILFTWKQRNRFGLKADLPVSKQANCSSFVHSSLSPNNNLLERQIGCFQSQQSENKPIVWFIWVYRQYNTRSQPNELIFFV